MTLLQPNPPSWRQMFDDDARRRHVALEAYAAECERHQRTRELMRWYGGIALVLAVSLAVRMVLT